MAFNEIENLEFLANGNIYKLKSPELDGVLVKDPVHYLVVIPYNWETMFFDTFMGIEFKSDYLNIAGGQAEKVLILKAKASIDFAKFKYIAYDFVLKANRQEIISNPQKWTDQWRNIFGDSIKKKMVFDVVGELISFYHILKDNKTAKWVGAEKGSQDIVADKFLAEVKTTTKKKDYLININSAIQIQKEKPEFLYFCRLEEKPHSLYSINYLVRELENLGYPRNELEDSLHQLGLSLGNRDRDKTYDLIELLSFEVQKAGFPVFDLEKLNAHYPTHPILDYKLLIDLSSFDKTIIYSVNQDKEKLEQI